MSLACAELASEAEQLPPVGLTNVQLSQGPHRCRGLWGGIWRNTRAPIGRWDVTGLPQPAHGVNQLALLERLWQVGDAVRDLVGGSAGHHQAPSGGGRVCRP